jgi:hypothetical protein
MMMMTPSTIQEEKEKDRAKVTHTHPAAGGFCVEVSRSG